MGVGHYLDSKKNVYEMISNMGMDFSSGRLVLMGCRMICNVISQRKQKGMIVEVAVCCWRGLCDGLMKMEKEDDVLYLFLVMRSNLKGEKPVNLRKKKIR